MNKLIQTGRLIFALGMVALGAVCFIAKDFIVGRPHAWPAGFEPNPLLAYISGSILIVAAIAVIFKVKGVAASLVIAILIFVLSVLRDLPFLMADWLNTYKAIALLGGALVVASSFLKEQGQLLTSNGGNKGLAKIFILTGCIMLAIFFVAGGYAHFKFADFVTNFIPSYIPFRAFWTYFCGVCLVAGGIGILIPSTRRIAALLAAIMLSGWFVLLHIPRFLANMNDASDRMGLCESFTFAGIFFVLAGLCPRKARLEN